VLSQQFLHILEPKYLKGT